MNERIQELAVQARNHALDEKRIYERMHNTEQCMEEYREVYNKRFAELIVAECISKLDDIGVIDRDSRTIAMKVISEHFGVEE